MVIKIKHIIIGTYNNLFNKFDKESLRRLEICNRCEHKQYLKGFGHYCDSCGCIIKSKITVKDEKCPKW